MRRPYVIYESYYSSKERKVVKKIVADYYSEESALDQYNLLKDNGNIILEKSVGNHVYTWNEAHEEWEI